MVDSQLHDLETSLLLHLNREGSLDHYGASKAQHSAAAVAYESAVPV